MRLYILIFAIPVTVVFQTLSTIRLWRHGWPWSVAIAWSRDVSNVQGRGY